MNLEQKPKKKPGPPPTELTAEQKKSLKECISVGLPLEDTALIVGVSPDTLKRHFKKEIDTIKAKRKLEIYKAMNSLLKSTNPKTSTFKIYWDKKRNQNSDVKPPAPKIEIIVAKPCESTSAETSDKPSSTTPLTTPDKPAE